MKKLFILLVNYNNLSDTEDCLESLSHARSDLADIHIVVIDNASRNGNRIQGLKHKYRSIHLIENKKNLGFSGGNNTGIQYALAEGADYIMLLNNDTRIDKFFIDPLIAGLESHSAGIVGPKIYFEKGYEFHKDRYTEAEKGNVIWYAGGIIDWDNVHAFHRGVDEVDIGRYNQSTPTQFVSGCCLLTSRTVIEEIGMLDDAYFMYMEDVDFCVRAQRAGYGLYFIPDSHVYHKNAQSSGSSGSDLHVYYQTRNRLYFGMKYAPFRTKLALIKHSLHVLRNTKRRDAVIDFYLMRFGKKASLHNDS